MQRHSYKIMKRNNIQESLWFCRKTGILVVSDPPHEGVNNVESALKGTVRQSEVLNL